jgi:hypothetical protein
MPLSPAKPLLDPHSHRIIRLKPAKTVRAVAGETDRFDFGHDIEIHIIAAI